MKKILLILAFMLLFTGCDDVPKNCKADGWQGMLIVNNVLSALDDVCSDGELTPKGDYYRSSSGNRLAKYYYYFPFDTNNTQVSK